MPTIGEMEYGFDSNGIESYLDEIKASVLETAKNDVLDISSIKNVCDAEWTGIAKDNFLQNLEKDTRHVAEQYDELFNVLTSEVNSIAAAMANKDEKLIDID